jgi:hypothetical protein
MLMSVLAARHRESALSKENKVLQNRRSSKFRIKKNAADVEQERVSNPKVLINIQSAART